MSKVIYRGPKRQIDRVHSRIVDTSILSSQETVTIYTAEDAVTLIRILAHIIISPIDGAMASPMRGEYMIELAPRGVSVATDVSTSQSLDENVPIEEIARFPWSVMMDTTSGILQEDRRTIDMKAMRKMKEGDELHFAIVTGKLAISSMGTFSSRD